MKKENLPVVHFEYKGQEREQCRDIFCHVSWGGNTVLCMADGVSSARFGGIGAYLVEQSLTRMLRDAGDIRFLHEEEMKYQVCCAIREMLERMVRESGYPRKEFASTLMAVIVPEHCDFVWLIHVGDGMICGLNEEGTLDILSYPHYGILKEYPYTTAEPDLYRWLHVRKKEKKGWVFTMTDGITEEIFSPGYELKTEYAILLQRAAWDELETQLVKNLPPDDIGFAAIQIGVKGGENKDG